MVIFLIVLMVFFRILIGVLTGTLFSSEEEELSILTTLNLVFPFLEVVVISSSVSEEFEELLENISLNY